MIGLVLSACGFQLAGEQKLAPREPIPCDRVASVWFANTSITTTLVAAGAFTAPVQSFPGWAADYTQLPAFCRVTGSIKPTADSDIRFELWLPAEIWNGNFMQTGNGAAAGSIMYSSLVDPLSRGYAVANTDTGHRGMGGEFTWAAGHPERLTDYAYRAVHELTVVGKAITTTHYGKTPQKSYWNGCSTGGRQGLKEAQRFPEDYDAIVAGAPANNWLGMMSLSILIQNNMGPEGLGVNKLGILKQAAMESCDALDGVRDNVISVPVNCTFDPVVTRCEDRQSPQCLDQGEVEAARRIYAGVVNRTGETLMPGTGPGSEPLWAAYASPQFRIGESYFQNVVMEDQAWDSTTFRVDTDLTRAEQTDNGAVAAIEPDLSAFIANGGKLIIYHGTVDGLIPYGSTVNYFESVVGRLGAERIEDHVKLYLVPGMSHCSGGDGAYAIDWQTAMEEWTARGKTPGILRALRPDVIPGMYGSPPITGGGYTRPVCEYPKVVTYRGSGDNRDATNFECTVP